MPDLEDAARDARERAETSINPADHALANALAAAVHAQQHPPPPPGDTTGIPSPGTAGYIEGITFLRPDPPTPDAPNAPGTPGSWTEG